jgi:hypothetical protein
VDGVECCVLCVLLLFLACLVVFDLHVCDGRFLFLACLGVADAWSLVTGQAHWSLSGVRFLTQCVLAGSSS